MTLGSNMRGFRAATTMLACAGLALSPAVANAAAKKHLTKKQTAALKEAKNAKPSGTIVTVAKMPTTTSKTGLGERLGLNSTLQLAAMNTAIKATPTYFSGSSTGCNNITALLAAQPGAIMAGNFRDSAGNCYVWLNLEQSSTLSGSEICKTTLHEMGHLTGLQHSTDSNDVMFSPFQSDPIPAPCVAQPAKAKTASASFSTCPPGATGADYCQAMSLKKPAKRSRARRAHKAA
jgi:hypothetical protein